MSSHNIVNIDTQTTDGEDLAVLLEDESDARITGNLDSTRPAWAKRGYTWVKEVGNLFFLMVYDGSGDVPVAVLDTLNDVARSCTKGDVDTYLAHHPTADNTIIGVVSNKTEMILNSSGLTLGTATAGNIALETNATDALGLPVGNNAQRPSNPKKGYCRYNNESNFFEFWNGSRWVPVSGGLPAITSGAVIKIDSNSEIVNNDASLRFEVVDKYLFGEANPRTVSAFTGVSMGQGIVTSFSVSFADAAAAKASPLPLKGTIITLRDGASRLRGIVNTANIGGSNGNQWQFSLEAGSVTRTGSFSASSVLTIEGFISSLIEANAHESVTASATSIVGINSSGTLHTNTPNLATAIDGIVSGGGSVTVSKSGDKITIGTEAVLVTASANAIVDVSAGGVVTTDKANFANEIDSTVSAGTGLSKSKTGNKVTLALDATTDNVPEGTSNNYFTNDRADARIALASITDLADVETPQAEKLLRRNADNDSCEWVAVAQVSGLDEAGVADFLGNTLVSGSGGVSVAYSDTANSGRGSLAFTLDTASPNVFTTDRARGVISAPAGSIVSYSSGNGEISTNVSGLASAVNTIVAGGEYIDITRSGNTLTVSATLPPETGLDAEEVADLMGNTVMTAGTGVAIAYSDTANSGSGSITVRLDATTDNIPEGTTNLYHTTSRGRGLISAEGTAVIDYDSSTGVFSTDTAQLASDVHSFIGNGSGIVSSTSGNVETLAVDFADATEAAQGISAVKGMSPEGVDLFHQRSLDSDSVTGYTRITSGNPAVGQVKIDGGVMLLNPNAGADAAKLAKWAYAGVNVTASSDSGTGLTGTISTAPRDGGGGYYTITLATPYNGSGNWSGNVDVKFEGAARAAIPDDTDDLSEGSTNLYYTDARADARIAAADTDDLSEGSTNLYYTDARADARIAAADTDALSEGSGNLYFTNARADARALSVIDYQSDPLNYQYGIYTAAGVIAFGNMRYTAASKTLEVRGEAPAVRAKLVSGLGKIKIEQSESIYLRADVTAVSDIDLNNVLTLTLDNIVSAGTLSGTLQDPRTLQVLPAISKAIDDQAGSSGGGGGGSNLTLAEGDGIDIASSGSTRTIGIEDGGVTLDKLTAGTGATNNHVLTVSGTAIIASASQGGSGGLTVGGTRASGRVVVAGTGTDDFVYARDANANAKALSAAGSDTIGSLLGNSTGGDPVGSVTPTTTGLLPVPHPAQNSTPSGTGEVSFTPQSTKSTFRCDLSIGFGWNNGSGENRTIHAFLLRKIGNAAETVAARIGYWVNTPQTNADINAYTFYVDAPNTTSTVRYRWAIIRGYSNQNNSIFPNAQSVSFIECPNQT